MCVLSSNSYQRQQQFKLKQQQKHHQRKTRKKYEHCVHLSKEVNINSSSISSHLNEQRKKKILNNFYSNLIRD